MQGQRHRFVTSTVSQTPFPLLRKASFLGFNAHSPTPIAILEFLTILSLIFLWFVSEVWWDRGARARDLEPPPTWSYLPLSPRMDPLPPAPWLRAPGAVTTVSPVRRCPVGTQISDHQPSLQGMGRSPRWVWTAHRGERGREGGGESGVERERERERER